MFCFLCLPINIRSFIIERYSLVALNEFENAFAQLRLLLKVRCKQLNAMINVAAKGIRQNWIPVSFFFCLMIRLIVIASSSSMTQMIITSFFMDVPFVVQFSIFLFSSIDYWQSAKQFIEYNEMKKIKTKSYFFFLVNLPKFIVVVRLVCLFCDAVVTLCAHRNPLWCQSNGTYLILFGLHLVKEINNHLYVALQHEAKMENCQSI